MKNIYQPFIKTMIVPIIIAITLIGLFTYGAFLLSINAYEKMNDQNSIQSIKLNADLIQKNRQIQTIIHEDVLWRSIHAGQMVMENQDLLSNEYLAKIATMFNIELLYWFDHQGVQLYSANGLFNGYQIVPNTPLYDFWISDLDFYVEPVRLSVNRNVYVKFVYFRNESNHFLQVGVTADYLKHLTEDYHEQATVTTIANQNDHILYALVLDDKLVTIADSDLEDIGTSYMDDPDYAKVLNGETIKIKWYYPKIQANVYEYATPLYDEDGTITGVLAIGYSLETLVEGRNRLVISTLTLAIFIIVTFQIVIIAKVFVPIAHLNQALASFDSETNEFSIFKKYPRFLDSFYDTISSLSDKINHHTELLLHQAKTDYLLQIPNRMSAEKTMDELINNQIKFAIIYVDIDNFKTYNDQKGHQFGDELLKDFTQIMLKMTKSNIFARHGGDEFIIIHPYKTRNKLTHLVETIHQTFNKPHQGYKDFYTISMGISIYPNDGHTVTEIIRKSNIALHHAKENGKQRFAYYQESFETVMLEELKIESMLKNALNEDGFLLVYQPQVDITTNQITSIEALLRLKNHYCGPDVFIAVAEQKGLIVDIGKWVITHVFKQMAEWKNEGISHYPCHINFSAHQLIDSDIIDFLTKQLEKYQISAEMIVIEITESALITHESVARSILSKIRKSGCKIALDDFGVGVSGINYLVNIEFDIIKLDKVLADKYLNKEDFSIYQSIIQLIETMGLQIVAEGIETESQINLLKASGCHLVQGYYYFKPLSASKITELLKPNL